MLVLTRKPKESIQIGPDIIVTFVGLDSRGQARIGIVAPPAVEIVRSEIVRSEIAKREVRP